MNAVHYNCPKCGSRLIIKDGHYGKFLACPRFPECRYTKALWVVSPAYGQPSKELKPICDICNGTGFLPFIKDGKVIPYARIYCECHEEEERYQPVRPEDFDFPISYDYYRSLCQFHGWPDPGSDIPPNPLEEDDTEIPEPEWTKRQWDTVQQLRGEVRHYSSKVNEMRAQASRKPKHRLNLTNT